MKIFTDNTHYGLAQFTGSGQIPIWTTNLKLTNQNSQVLEMVRINKPDIVILHAKWTDYLNLDELVFKIEETVSKIKKESPSSKVIVIGPVPKWKDTIQHCMMYFYFYKSMHKIPSIRMQEFLEPKVAIYDSRLEADLSKAGLIYISAIKVLCNDDGCIYRDGDLPQNLYTIDTAHLSKSGSEFLIEKIKSNLR